MSAKLSRDMHRLREKKEHNKSILYERGICTKPLLLQLTFLLLFRVGKVSLQSEDSQRDKRIKKHLITTEAFLFSRDTLLRSCCSKFVLRNCNR